MWSPSRLSAAREAMNTSGIGAFGQSVLKGPRGVTWLVSSTVLLGRSSAFFHRRGGRNSPREGDWSSTTAYAFRSRLIAFRLCFLVIEHTDGRSRQTTNRHCLMPIRLRASPTIFSTCSSNDNAVVSITTASGACFSGAVVRCESTRSRFPRRSTSFCTST